MKLGQLAGLEPTEIMVPLTGVEIASLLKENKHWQRTCNNFFLRDQQQVSPKHETLVYKTNWILPHIVKATPVSEGPTFYNDADNSGKVGYKSRKISKMPYGITRFS